MWTSNPVNIVLAALVISAVLVSLTIVLDPRIWKKKTKQSPAERAASKPGIVIDTGQAPRSQHGNRITETERQAALESIRGVEEE